MKKDILRRVRLFLVLSLVLSLGACGTPKSNVAEKEIRLMLDWTPSTNHTGIYLAEHFGFYEDAGITLTILQPPDSGPLPLVAMGQAEFGISFQEELASALTSDAPLPVTGIAGIIAHNTSGIVSLKESHITSPKDLEGKRLVAWDTPLVEGIMADIVSQDGGGFKKVEMVFNNVTDVVSALQSGVDAVWVFYAWDGVATEVAGLETSYFSIADENPIFDYYTPIIVAGDSFLEENPQLAKDFLAATEKGYLYAMEHPEESAKIFTQMVPELNYEQVLAGQIYLADKYKDKNIPWGEIDETRWNNFYQWMYEEGIIPQDITGQGFTNQYLPS